MKSDLRVLILSPTVFPQITGNAVTVERWRRLLTARGVSVEVLATQSLGAGALLDVMAGFAPHIVHAHHASKSGAFMIDSRIAARHAEMPFVVSPAGTDMSGGKDAHGTPEAVLEVLRRAQVIIVQNDWLASWLRKRAPELCSRMVPVSKSVMPGGDASCDLRTICGWEPGHIIFFHPAGIRPVKGNLECLLALEGVYKTRPRLRVVFAGPVLDAAYGEKFLTEIKRLSAFARWFAAIPPEAMTAAYASVDVVLNTSFSEGLSNALLEAMAAGRPVLVSDIDGNRGPVLGEGSHMPGGLLFHPFDPGDFQRQATTLMDDEQLRIDLGRAGRAKIAACFRSEEEAAGLLQAYTMALAGC